MVSCRKRWQFLLFFGKFSRKHCRKETAKKTLTHHKVYLTTGSYSASASSQPRFLHEVTLSENLNFSIFSAKTPLISYWFFFQICRASKGLILNRLHYHRHPSYANGTDTSEIWRFSPKFFGVFSLFSLGEKFSNAENLRHGQWQLCRTVFQKTRTLWNIPPQSQETEKARYKSLEVWINSKLSKSVWKNKINDTNHWIILLSI